MCNPALESVNDFIYEGEVLSSKEKDFSICALSFSLIKSWSWKSVNNLKTYEVTTLKSILILYYTSLLDCFHF